MTVEIDITTVTCNPGTMRLNHADKQVNRGQGQQYDTIAYGRLNVVVTVRSNSLTASGYGDADV